MCFNPFSRRKLARLEPIFNGPTTGQIDPFVHPLIARELKVLYQVVIVYCDKNNIMQLPKLKVWYDSK